MTNQQHDEQMRVLTNTARFNMIEKYRVEAITAQNLSFRFYETGFHTHADYQAATAMRAWQMCDFLKLYPGGIS